MRLHPIQRLAGASTTIILFAVGSSAVRAADAVRLGTAATKLIPIVLDVAGPGGSRFTTELTLANRGTTATLAQLTYTPATSLGASGRGSASTSLAAGRQLVIPDAIAYLRSQGLAIPSGSDQGGTLRVEFSGLSSEDVAYAGARTTTPSGSGRAGLAYPGVSLKDAPTGTSYVYGLRSTADDRTNLALVNAGTASPVTLRVTLFSGIAGDGRAFTMAPDTILEAGQWVQIGRILDRASFVNGYARIDLVSGVGPYIAYAVFNDNTTNDGSYVPIEPANQPSEFRLLPVIVESAAFQSELVLTNPFPAPQTASLTYVESLSPGAGSGGSIAVSLLPGEQQILPNVIDYLRQKGIAIGAKGSAGFAGSLSVTFKNGTSTSSCFVGARTAAPADGTGPGEYGVFYPGVSPTFAAAFEAWVYGLQQSGANRSNLAVANLGDASGSLTFKVEVYDGDSGQLAGSTAPATLAPGGWTQINAVLQPFGVANGFARVVKLSGNDRFLVYGVLNDGGAPGQGTSDGSYVAGQVVSPAPAPPALELDGNEVNVVAAGQFGLQQLPDEHPSYLRLPDGTNRWWVAANGSTYALDTSDFTRFVPAPSGGGQAVPGLAPSGTLGTAFDADYAGPGTVFPAASGKDLLMLYHAENHYGRAPAATGVTAFYSSIGLARSTDGGLTWARRGEVVTGREPRSPTFPPPAQNIGASVPAAIVSGGFIYVFYKDTVSPGAPLGPHRILSLARAPVAGDGAPGTWQKYYQGSFSQPGLGGLSDPLFAAPVPATGVDVILDPAPTFNSYLNAFVLTFMGDDGFYFTTSTDLLQWSAPSLFFRFPTPRGAALSQPGQTYFHYQALVTPQSTSDQVTGQTGYFFYAKGTQDPALKQNTHSLYRQGFAFR